MKLASEKVTPASRTTEVTIVMVPVGGSSCRWPRRREAEVTFSEAMRRAEEDAAIDAEDILTQAEEANALDPVG